MESRRLLAAVPMLALPLAAQVFVVDASNGPGANFTSIAAAVAAVPDGAILRVRPGNYDAFRIDGKSLTVLNEGGLITGPPTGANVTVANLAATQSVVLRGLTWQNPNGGLSLTSCNGLVACYQCWNQSNLQSTIVVGVSQCRQVHLVDCSFLNYSGGSTVVNTTSSDAVFERCGLFGSQGGIPLWVHGGRVQLVSCGMNGGPTFNIPSAPAVRMTQADVRVLGGSLSSSLSFTMGNTYAIDGTGTLRIDPSTVLQGNPMLQPISPTLSPQFVAMPIVEASYSSAPAATTATLRAPAGWLGALYLGFPVAPAALPGFVDEVWIDPATAVVVASGVFAGTTVNVAVPNFAQFLGTRLAWQGVTFDATAGLQLSDPAAITIW
jgi:hypothetical protein